MPIAVENPRVMVARTFSKAYGMAGLRMGYAIGHVDTIKKMAEWDGGNGGTSLNVLALHAATTAINHDPSYLSAERARNKAVRDFTAKWFMDRGMKPTDSQANFMFVNIGRPATPQIWRIPSTVSVKSRGARATTSAPRPGPRKR